MNAEIFEELKQAVAVEMGADVKDMKVITKNLVNMDPVTGICIPEGDGPAVTVYVDEAVDEIERGRRSCKECAREIAVQMKIYKDDAPAEAKNVVNFTKDDFLDRMFIQLISAEKNEAIWNKFPHVDFLDMMGIFKVEVCENAVFTMTDEIMKDRDITMDEMKEAALKNMDAVKMITPLEYPVVLVTNKDLVYGAGQLMNKSALREVSDIFKKDLYILPSSIHEIMIVPAPEVELDFLRKMLDDGNRKVTRAEDYLSDNVYEYNRESGQVTIARSDHEMEVMS